MLATIVWTLFVAGDPAAKLPAATAKEMTEVIIAVNKALGSRTGRRRARSRAWIAAASRRPSRRFSAEDTRQCASTAIAHGFSGLGKDYALGIPMAHIGPVTVFAIGIGEAEGWGAYSCDPKRRCAPTKLSAGSKQAKRLTERRAKACADARRCGSQPRPGVRRHLHVRCRRAAAGGQGRRPRAQARARRHSRAHTLAREAVAGSARHRVPDRRQRRGALPLPAARKLQ